MKEKEIDTVSIHNKIICPYCGHTFDVDCETFSDNGDCEEEMECEECGKTFIAEQSVSYMYETFKKEEEEKK